MRLRTPALLVCMLSACSSAPVHYHTLLPPPTDSGGPTAAFAIEVLPPTIPAQVDLPQLIVRQGDGGMGLVETEQWIAPLADEIRAALSARLSQRLHALDVYRSAQAVDARVFHVQLNVRRFDSQLGSAARIEGVWTLRSRAPAPLLQCAAQAEEHIGSGYAPLVQGHQRALMQIADQIAEHIAAIAGGGAARCDR